MSDLYLLTMGSEKCKEVDVALNRGWWRRIVGDFVIFGRSKLLCDFSLGGDMGFLHHLLTPLAPNLLCLEGQSHLPGLPVLKATKGISLQSFQQEHLLCGQVLAHPCQPQSLSFSCCIVETFSDLAFSDIFLHLLTGNLTLLGDEFALEEFCTSLFDGFFLTACSR